MTRTSEFRDFTGIMQARLTLITYRSVVRRNIAIQAAILERPRKVCPSVLHEKPTSLSSTRQVVRGNGGISRARAESNIAECANERFLPPFFLCPLPPSYTKRAWYIVREMHKVGEKETGNDRERQREREREREREKERERETEVLSPLSR